ncbi:sugar phosphate isomerase/epimerase family protein [Rhizobium leguminosarum]|uniref:sugar phosphate isomerase/epimerase family protein n=1 Tax=Rhizobium leguminosarum TaxID=384 RepID=UPI000FEC7224|nr:sugar phosphate isomerase/epimerase [Rhizobium leguminosarum]RWX36650.1 sugar phosphate isomerase/epimerase [Rhizobium leguminosarum]
MKIGMVSDSLSHLALKELLLTSRELGVSGIEFNTGNWSAGKHFDLATFSADQQAARDFRTMVEDHGLSVIALNANGNQLHPTDGARQDKVVRDTIRAAGHMGVDKVCLMSGLPGAGPDEQFPNWIVSSWPPETQTILAWQWAEKLIPYWTSLARFARDHGVEKLCVELHGNQLVFNVPTLLALREAVGPVVGANLDPSHLMWMGADPLAAMEALGSAVYHVHAKDTWINGRAAATRSRLENGPLDKVSDRAWSYITLGFGKSQEWWKEFVYRLRLLGYDGWLSIEHEDVAFSRREGVERSVAVLNQAVPFERPDFAPQAI